jgi:Concanavalin A-like lectin/glucanases superfamily
MSSTSTPVLRVRASRLAPVLVLAGLLAAAAAQAQPFGAWTIFDGPTQQGYLRVPHNAALNPTSAFTFEAWVSLSKTVGPSCDSIAGKSFTEAWWVGICGSGQALRSYIKGSPSIYNAGTVPVGQWTHVAVVYDGVSRRHYINGELVGTNPETGPLTTSGDEVRIGGDTAYQHSPHGGISEVRLWSVARTVGQLRTWINKSILAPQTGLVAVWPMGGTSEPIHGYVATVQGAGIFPWTFPVALDCGSSTVNALCLQTRFSISATYRTGAPGTPESPAHVVVAGPNSGIFWFFSSDNWEVMVKAINACGYNSRYWIYTAATTDVFYRLEVFDIRAGVNKVYFNYPGAPAPAVTDSDAFATCP